MVICFSFGYIRKTSFDFSFQYSMLLKLPYFLLYFLKRIRIICQKGNMWITALVYYI
uniref:Uncharacterized protein n=1 Tax=Arundo donax TaxID=35708 RepID=A0A0A9FHW5_ARUDO